MTAILRRLPFFEKTSTVTVRGAPLRVKGHQIVVWVSLTFFETARPEAGVPRFPAILDTGNTQGFSLRESHLRQWAGIDPRFLSPLGTVRHAGRTFPMHAARLWLHRNKPGARDLFQDAPAHMLDLPRGVIVYPDRDPLAPRLPLLGLRVLRRNQLHLYVNAERGRVSLRTPDWVTRLFGWW